MDTSGNKMEEAVGEKTLKENQPLEESARSRVNTPAHTTWKMRNGEGQAMQLPCFAIGTPSVSAGVTRVNNNGRRAMARTRYSRGETKWPSGCGVTRPTRTPSVALWLRCLPPFAPSSGLCSPLSPWFTF